VYIKSDINFLIGADFLDFFIVNIKKMKKISLNQLEVKKPIYVKT